MNYLIILTLLLTPTYVVRFNIGPLPTNLLMVWVFFVWLAFLIYLISKKQMSVFLTAVKNTDKKIITLIALFFLSGLISLFVGGLDKAKLGQFIVLFLQPISIFFIAKFTLQDNLKSKNFLLLTFYFLLSLAGAYALLQYFSGIGLPVIFQGNPVEPRRAVSFFGHPNFYALFSAPLLAFLIPHLTTKVKIWKDSVKNLFFILAWLIGALGLFLSLSRSGWLGLAAAVVVYLVIAADKKIIKLAIKTILIIFLIIIAIPSLRLRLTQPFHGEKSSNSRIELWQSGLKGIGQSPIFGLGLNGYSKHYWELMADKTLDTHNFPHNIFLDLWLETGLIGLISLTGLIIIYIYRGLRFFPRSLQQAIGKGKKIIQPLLTNELIKLSVALFLIAFLAQGQIDNPYFKNDLAMVFWIILALI